MLWFPGDLLHFNFIILFNTSVLVTTMSFNCWLVFPLNTCLTSGILLESSSVNTDAKHSLNTAVEIDDFGEFSTDAVTRVMWRVVSVNARLDVNVALNRSSYESSTYSNNDGTYHAHYANDGRHGTDLVTGPCAHTQTAGSNPWWAVDLGAALYVTGVKFTNRNSNGTSYSVISVSILCELTFRNWHAGQLTM